MLNGRVLTLARCSCKCCEAPHVACLSSCALTHVSKRESHVVLNHCSPFGAAPIFAPLRMTPKCLPPWACILGCPVHAEAETAWLLLLSELSVYAASPSDLALSFLH